MCEAALTLHPMNETTHSSILMHAHRSTHMCACTHKHLPVCMHTDALLSASALPSLPATSPHCTSPCALLYIKHPNSWSNFENQALIMTENPVHHAKETGMSPCVRLKMAFESTEAPVVANWATVCLIVRLLYVPTTLKKGLHCEKQF